MEMIASTSPCNHALFFRGMEDRQWNYILPHTGLLGHFSLPERLFIGGRFGERAGGESSSEEATVLIASW